MKDFSIQFWALLGVNRRVYNVKDIFEKKTSQETQTKQRDKQADERQFNKFKNNDDSIGVEAFIINQHLDETNFYQLCNGLFSHKDDKFYFYRSQLLNLLRNYKLFKQLELSEKYFINLFAFQIALIMQYMNFHNLSTDCFEQAIEKKTLWSFIELLFNTQAELKRKDIIAKTSVNYNQMLNSVNHTQYAEYISDATLNKNFSTWKNNQSLPELLKIIALTITRKKDLKADSQETTAYFFQFLMARGLLEIKKQHSLESENSFIQCYYSFKEQLHTIFQCEENPISKIKETQTSYAIDLESIYTLNLNPRTDGVQYINSLLEKFLKNNPDEKHENEIKKLHALLNPQHWIKLFNNGQLHELLDTFITYENNHTVFSPFLYLITVLTAYKIGNKTLITTYEKYFDKNFGGFLFSNKNAHHRFKKDLIQQIQAQQTFENCLVIFQNHLKNIQR